jgi:hypothetical protein
LLVAAAAVILAEAIMQLVAVVLAGLELVLARH